MALLQEAAQERELQTSVDSLRREMALMRKDAAGERGQQGAIGDKMAVLPDALKEKEAIKGKGSP